MVKQILSCDWGTTNFRLRLVDFNSGSVVDEIISSKGIAAVNEEWMKLNKDETERMNFYKKILQSFITQLKYDVKDVPVIISGMASSTIGMKELDYTDVPFDLSKHNLNTFKITADNKCAHDILLISGLKTNKDVMRGEETMLFGCDIQNDEEAVFIFPGTHSKHVLVKNNIIVDFKTYMSGEIFNLLCNKSILSGSVKENNNEHQNAFITGVKEGTSNNLLNSIFHIQTNQLFKKFTTEENYHFLSGLIIGTELKGVKNKNICLVCGNSLAEQYLSALKIIGTDFLKYSNADEAFIKGHSKLIDSI